MEVILSTAFGRSVDVQGGKGGEIYEAACGVFKAALGKPSTAFRMIRIVLCTYVQEHAVNLCIDLAYPLYLVYYRVLLAPETKVLIYVRMCLYIWIECAYQYRWLQRLRCMFR